jgi:hypothetical protein
MTLIQYFETNFQFPFSFAFPIWRMKSSNDIKAAGILHTTPLGFSARDLDGIAVV